MLEKSKFTPFTKLIIIPAAVIFVAALLGSISAGAISADETQKLKGYLDSFFGSVPKGGSSLFFSSAKKYICVWLLISVSAAVLPAFIINLATLCERGFVMGYTAAGFCRIYGAKGIFACVSLLPEMLIFVPVLVVFSSISLKMSFFSHETKKVFLKKYIFLALIFLSAFCVVSLFQTFATTTFMRLISSIL